MDCEPRICFKFYLSLSSSSSSRMIAATTRACFFNRPKITKFKPARDDSRRDPSPAAKLGLYLVRLLSFVDPSVMLSALSLHNTDRVTLFLSLKHRVDFL